MDADIAIAKIADRYEILERIGEGAMSVVYRACDPKRRHRQFAIKLLKASSSSSRLENVIRFRAEANTVAKLIHPHIVKVFEVGEVLGRHYIVMEYLRGRSLHELLSLGKPLSVQDSIIVVEQIARALEYVHSSGIVHRDRAEQRHPGGRLQ